MTTPVVQGSLGSPFRGQSKSLLTGLKPGKDTLSPRSVKLHKAHPGKSEAEIRSFQKLKRRRLQKQSEKSFLSSILSDLAEDQSQEEDEQHEEDEQPEEEKEGKEETDDEGNNDEHENESSEDEIIFPLN